MWKSTVWVVLILALVVLPAAAQEVDDPLAWIPADFAGYVRLNVESADSLTAVNVASFVASFLQPQRVNMQTAQSLDNLIPLTQLDVEDANYARDIFPWLGDHIIVAYRSFGPDMQVEAAVLILPTRDVLQSASSFTRIFEQQDILRQEDYRGTKLYLADKSTIAFTPQAVLVGETEAVKVILDVQANDGARLIDQPAYQAIHTNDTQAAFVSGYLDGAQITRALSVLLEGDESALPVLQDFNTALGTYRKDTSLEQLALAGALDGVGFTLQADTLRLNSVQVNLTLYDADTAAVPVESVFNPDVLNLLPQNAMIVHSGTNAPGLAYDLLTALPLMNFASEIFGAFPVQQSAATANALLSMPDAADIEQALGGFLTVLNRQANFDMDHDLLQHLSGSYAIALLPRPNDPLPPLNSPYDLLLLVEVDDADAALAGASTLARTLLAVETLETHTVDDDIFLTAGFNDEPVLYLGVVDNLLLLATGDALNLALDARRGDDRLVNRDRWHDVGGDSIPQLYVDIPAVYGTFLPQLVGPQLQQIRQLGARSTYRGDGLFDVELTVTLPSQLS